MNRPYLAGWLFVALATGCSSPSNEGKSTGTNWLECQDDTHCARVEGATCRRDHVCMDRGEKPIPASVVDGSGGASTGGQGTSDAEGPSGGTPSGGTPSGGTPSGGAPSGGIPSGGAPSGGPGDSPPTRGAKPPVAAGSCLLEYNDALASGDPCCYRQGGTNTCNTSIMCNDLSGAGCCLIYGTDTTTGGSRCCLYDAGKFGEDAECRTLLAQSR